MDILISIDKILDNSRMLKTSNSFIMMEMENDL